MQCAGKLDAAAKALGISLVRVAMDSLLDFQDATAAIAREHVDAIVTGSEATFSVRKELADFAIQQRLPLMVTSPADDEWRRAGVLWC